MKVTRLMMASCGATVLAAASLFSTGAWAANAAEARYDADMKHCRSLKGNERDVCEQKAKAARDDTKADAKANKKKAEAQHDAVKEKRDAAYKVAKEKCDAMSGDAKDACIAQAKTKYGK